MIGLVVGAVLAVFSLCLLAFVVRHVRHAEPDPMDEAL